MTNLRALGGTPNSVRWLLVFDAMYSGAGYAFGPAQWSSSSSFAVVHQLNVPVPAWGVLWMVCGALLLLRRDLAGHLLGTLSYLFWGGCVLATIPSGEISGWGGPAHLLLIAGLHFLGALRISRATNQATRTTPGGEAGR